MICFENDEICFIITKRRLNAKDDTRINNDISRRTKMDLFVFLK